MQSNYVYAFCFADLKFDVILSSFRIFTGSTKLDGDAIGKTSVAF